MNDRRFYFIRVRGGVDEADIAASAPLNIVIRKTAQAATELAVETDQSGLIGVLRYLHGRSFFILGVRLDTANPGTSEENGASNR